MWGLNYFQEITEIIGVIFLKNVLIISATNDKNLLLANKLNDIISKMLWLYLPAEEIIFHNN